MLSGIIPPQEDKAHAATDKAPGTVIGRTSLLARLVILVVVSTIPALLVLAYLEHDLRAEGRERIGAEALRQAELLNADMSNVVEGARQLSLAISHFSTVRTGDPACSNRLAELRSDLPSYATLSVIRADGKIICTTDSGASGSVDATFLAHIDAIIDHGDFDVGTYLPKAGERAAMLPFCLPFTMESGGHAVVIVGLSLDWLGAHLAGLKRPAESTIGIADRNGVTVAREPEHDKFVGRLFPPAVSPYINAAKRGNAVVIGYDGKERLIGFVPATERPVGMFVSIGMYLPGVLAELDRATWRAAVLMTIGALVSLCLTLWVGHRFVRRPTAALLAAAHRWTAGDLSARAALTESPKSEFGSLARAFNDMAAALDWQRAELRDLNAGLEARVEARTRDLAESRNKLQVEIAERDKVEATLRQAQKLQAVGQLAGGIAHDFNNLLTAIIGALDLMRARLPSAQEGLVRLVDNALHAAKRGTKLTAQLLTFSRRQPLQTVPSDLNVIVVAVVSLLGSTLGRSIRIQTDLVQDLWAAMVDPSQIEAAIVNLAINARDAMPDGGVLTIATRNRTLGPGSVVAPGDYVAVRVSDTGTGMSPEVMSQAFEPFFTTKAPGRGAGLGLSQVHGQTMQSGGDVLIESTLGEGTAVTLLMPRARTVPVATRTEPSVASGGRRHGARLLVVDDDPDVRLVTAEMLRASGYAVEVAGDSDEALVILEEDAGFDALLVDYVMPGMDGMALAQHLRRKRPALRVLLMTGYAELRESEEVDTLDIIRKPFDVATLSERIEQILRRPMLRALHGGALGAP
jgi:signal transduction histidine kinase/CheY-like chemotaxis protein